MRDQPTSPQLPLATTPSAPVMRANASDSLAASVVTPAIKKRQRPKSNRYTAAWASAGVLAAAYAGAVLMGQEPVATLAGRWSGQDRDTSEIAAALARTQSEVAQLQRSVGTLEADMNRVKTQTTQADARERAAAARVDAVESRVERIGAQIAQVFAKGTPSQKGAPGPVAAARPIGAAIETGALPSKDTPPAQRELAATRHAGPEAAVTATPAQPQAAILLARGPSLDALRLSWSLLNERHKSSLGALEPRVVTTEPGTHQLVAGPFASSADAAKACATLKSRGVTCQPAEFKGEGL
jgi:uncharacterized coiled-coil protein SlyX